MIYINIVFCLCRICWECWGHPESQRQKHRFRLKLEKMRNFSSEKFKGSKSTPSHTRHFKSEITSINDIMSIKNDITNLC